MTRLIRSYEMFGNTVYVYECEYCGAMREYRHKVNKAICYNCRKFKQKKADMKCKARHDADVYNQALHDAQVRLESICCSYGDCNNCTFGDDGVCRLNNVLNELRKEISYG